MMQVTSVYSPAHGRHVRFGRKRATGIPRPRLHLRNYLSASLPTPPSVVDYSPAAMGSLSRVYVNDRLGCCVPSGAAHIRGVTSGNAGQLVTFTDQQIIDQYSVIGGYVPGDPNTDRGCNEEDALNYWMRRGFPDGVRLAGYLAVDATNPVECMTALWLFENLMFGVELPSAWVNPMPRGSGFLWDVAGPPDQRYGHCFIACAGTKTGPGISTWGMLGTVTWAAVAAYAVQQSGGQLFVLLSPDMIDKAKGKSPAGLAWADLIADFDAMGGNVPAPGPGPAPGPSPAPVPTAGPTSAQVIAAAHAALQATERALPPHWQQVGAQILNLAASKMDPAVQRLWSAQLLACAKRSPHWSAVERAHKAKEPNCQVCGTRTGVEVHHVQPFHLRPELELLESNLISLCRHDHYTWGHNGTSWSDFNPFVREDTAKCRKMLAEARAA